MPLHHLRRTALACAILFGVLCAQQRFPGHVYASIEVPELDLQFGSLKSQEEKLRILVKESNGDPYLLRELGRVIYRRGDTDLAKQMWDRAAAADPNFPKAEVELVFIAMANGDLAQAQQQLDRLNVASTKDAHVLIAAAELSMLRRDMQSANDLLLRAIDIAPQFWATHLTLGHFMEVSGDFETAQTFFEKVTELLPDRPNGWLRLAALHFRQGRVDEAFEAYRTAEKCKGRQPLAETRMGELYYLNNDHFAAYRFFNAAVRRNEEDPFPRLRLGQVLQRVGRTDEARVELEAILKTTEYPEALKSLAEMFFAQGEWKMASEYYRRALKVDPDDIVTCNNLAMLIVQDQGDAKDAVVLIERALQQSGNRQIPALKATQGCVLYCAGKVAEAEPMLAESVKILPNLPWVRYCYGNVLIARKKPAEARRQLEACLFLDPDFPRKPEVQELLSRPDSRLE